MEEEEGKENEKEEGQAQKKEMMEEDQRVHLKSANDENEERHDTRICCIKAYRGSESQLSLSDPVLSSACRAEHICILTGQIVTEYSEARYAL